MLTYCQLVSLNHTYFSKMHFKPFSAKWLPLCSSRVQCVSQCGLFCRRWGYQGNENLGVDLSNSLKSLFAIIKLCNVSNSSWISTQLDMLYTLWKTGISLGMGSANGRWYYNVTSSLIGWTHTQNDPGKQWSNECLSNAFKLHSKFIFNTMCWKMLNC